MIATTRRHMLISAAGLYAMTLPTTLGGRAFAQTPSDRKFVLIILRGGMDGLGAVPPITDPRYDSLRGRLAYTPDQVLALNDTFALHPALSGLHGLYQSGQAAIIHAAHPGHDSRSHFDAQDLLEGGVNAKADLADGWLNRALGRAQQPAQGLAIGASIPLVLQGARPTSSWAPNVLPEADPDTLDRLAALYAYDPLLQQALDSALMADALADDGDGRNRNGANGRAGGGVGAFARNAQAAARLMTAEGGASAVVMSLGGWDTHNGQGTTNGRLANALRQLDTGITALKDGLGETWSRTVVVVASEFGRTARANGAGGTDHGTGGAVFVLGGAVRGGRCPGDWPGLAKLHEDRDVAPANDVRAIIKGILADHWGLARADLGTHVFPGSAGVAPMAGLIG